ncbi:MAG: calcium-binding protein, partial [Pseudomonadota bacterium]
MPEDITGTDRIDRIIVGSGAQNVEGGGGNDRIVSLADAGEPDPAQTDGADGRVTEAIAPDSANDTLTGGDGADKFEFHALIDAKEEVV